MNGDTSFENTARVVRARLDPIAKVILSTLTDAVQTDKGTGRVTYPDWSMLKIATQTGHSISTVQRRLKLLVALKLVRRFVRPGRAYVFQPLVNQLPLKLTDAAQQPLLLPDAAAAVELEAHPASSWSKRGTQGRFVPVEVFHSIGQRDRSSVENLTDPKFHFQQVTGGCPQTGSVSVTDHIGQRDRSDRSARPIPDGAIGSTNNKQQTESATADAAGLPLVGIPMTAEQRHARSTDPGRQGNYPVLLALALHLGRDPIESRKWLAVPIAEEGDLRAATKNAANDTPLRYDLRGPTGEGVMYAACQVAWKILVREGRYRPDALFHRDEHARRHRRRGR